MLIVLLCDHQSDSVPSLLKIFMKAVNRKEHQTLLI